MLQMATSKIDVKFTAKGPATAADRRNKFRAEAKAKGHIRREYYATTKEHDRLKDILRELRADKTTKY